jgi:putative membrane protein
MSGPGSGENLKGGNDPKARPRTIDVGESEWETAEPERQKPDQSPGPETIEGDRVVMIADTVYAAEGAGQGLDAGTVDWGARPGILVRLLRRLAGLAVGLIAVGLLGAVISAAAARFLDGEGLWGAAALAGLGLLIFSVLALVVRDIYALSRLGSVTALRRQAEQARLSSSGKEAGRDTETVVRGVLALYHRRVDMEWPIAAFGDDRVSVVGSAGLIDALDDRVLAPLDRRARQVAAETARRAAVITAVSPFALLDMLATLTLTARAARRIGAIYGVRPGRIGTLSLVRRAFFTVIAAGAIDAADDLVGDLMGSGWASRLSRRAGIGVLNGLLAARLTLAIADEVRPLPWRPGRRPSPHAIVREVVVGGKQ